MKVIRSILFKTNREKLKLKLKHQLNDYSKKDILLLASLLQEIAKEK